MPSNHLSILIQMAITWACESYIHVRVLQRKVTVLPSDDITGLLLMTYLTVMSGPMETYTAADWNATFQNEMRFLIPVINATTLAFIVPQDYDTLVAM